MQFSLLPIFLSLTSTLALRTPLTARQPPPTSSALDFTLYKTQQAGSENQCWTGVEIDHVAPADIGKCNVAYEGFYTLRIDHLAVGYDCTGTLPVAYSLETVVSPCRTRFFLAWILENWGGADLECS